MSKQRAKGTYGENRILPYLQRVWPGASRTGSDHSSPWGKSDLKNTGDTVVEVKNWSSLTDAIHTGWPQALKTAEQTGKRPLLIVLRKRKPALDALVITDLRTWLDVQGAAEDAA